MSITLRNALEEAEPNLNHVLHHLADGILLVDTDGVVVYANPAAERLFGYETGKMEGCMLGYPVIAGVAEVEIPQDDATVLVAEFRSVEITWRERPAYLASFRDITQRKRAEKRVASLSKALVSAYERAQREVGHELHDGIGQMLLGVRLSLDSARRAGCEEIPERLQKLGTMVEEVIGELRRMSHELKPAVLDDFSFLEALHSLLERLRDETGLEVEFTSRGLSGGNTDMVETVAFRIVQEALTNVIRHAGVSRATLLVEETDGSLRLRIADDGNGFDVTDQSDDSIGLRGMAERAELIGGTFEVVSTPGRGTAITAVLPLSDSAR
ncbi:MAG: PAS domain S-box protein [bacterium]